jgi:DNA polymerase-3 subunit beta
VKFTCERDALVEALSTASRAASTRGGALPVLSGVLFELVGDQLSVTGSDLDLTITISTIVSGQSDGVAVLPAKLASDIARSFGAGAITVEVQTDEAHLSLGRSKFSLRVLPADEYPRFERPTGDEVTLDAQQFQAALKQVVPAASSDDSRPLLTGVLLAPEDDGLRLVATDSYRLSVRDLPGAVDLGDRTSVLVPSRALNELTRVLSAGELTLRLGARDASFELDRVRLTTRLIEGEFPNYRGLIPKNHPNRLVIRRDELLEALRRVRLMAQESTPVRLEMSEDGLRLRAITQDVGDAEEELDAVYTGTELTVAFNPSYLLEGVEVCQSEHVALETIDALKPALVKPVDESQFLYLLMPVRVS